MAFTPFRSLPRRPRGAPTPAGHGERGFGLVESLISVGIAATGLLAVAGLLATGANLQRTSRDGGRSGMAAMQQLEILRVLPTNDVRLALGGSLTANVNNHNGVINVPPAGQVRVRWLVQAGPAGTLDITVRAEPVVAGGRPSVVRSLLWR